MPVRGGTSRGQAQHIPHDTRRSFRGASSLQLLCLAGLAARLIDGPAVRDLRVERVRALLAYTATRLLLADAQPASRLHPCLRPMSCDPQPGPFRTARPDSRHPAGQERAASGRLLGEARDGRFARSARPRHPTGMPQDRCAAIPTQMRSSAVAQNSAASASPHASFNRAWTRLAMR